MSGCSENDRSLVDARVESFQRRYSQFQVYPEEADLGDFTTKVAEFIRESPVGNATADDFGNVMVNLDLKHFPGRLLNREPDLRQYKQRKFKPWLWEL